MNKIKLILHHPATIFTMKTFFFLPSYFAWIALVLWFQKP